MNTASRILIVCVLLWAGSAEAQGISIIQGSDGTSGTIMDLGSGFRLYSDSHENSGTIMDMGGGFQTFQFSSPHGGLQSGTILTLPSPNPSVPSTPYGLTPAPLLPFSPRGPIMPREHMAPVAPLTSNQGTFNTFGSGGGVGRFWR